MSSKYDFGDSAPSGNNSGDDRGYAPTFKIAPFIKMGGELTSLFTTESDYGQSIAVSYENGYIEDGILTKRTDKDDYKVFSWNDAPVIEDESLDVDDLPAVLNKSYAGTSYKYEIVAARLQADKEIGYGYSSTEDSSGPINLEDVLDGEDRFTVFEGSSEYGPNSCAKTTAKCLSTAGKGAVVDPDDQFNWARDNLELREELVGEEVIYAKIQRDSNESDHSFNHPIFVLESAGKMILPFDGDYDQGETTDDSSSSTDTSDESEADSEPDDDPVQEFYDTCNELSIDTEPAVVGLLEDMLNDDGNELTEDLVDRDEIVADLTS